MALSYNKKVKEPAFDSLGEANNMEIAAILQPGSGWSMETASSSVLKAQREWPLLKLEAPLHSGWLTRQKMATIMLHNFLRIFRNFFAF